MGIVKEAMYRMYRPVNASRTLLIRVVMIVLVGLVVSALLTPRRATRTNNIQLSPTASLSDNFDAVSGETRKRFPQIVKVSHYDWWNGYIMGFWVPYGTSTTTIPSNQEFRVPTVW